MKTGLIISGVRGRMGRALVAAAAAFPDMEILGGLEHAKHADLDQLVEPGSKAKVLKTLDQISKQRREFMALIEFTSPEATLAHLKECVALQIPMVIGTTGLSEKQKEDVGAAAEKIPVVMAPNFSIGITLMTKIAEELAAKLPENYDLEVVEIHHRLKKDAPSGTALGLAEALARGRKKHLQEVLCTKRDGLIGERPRGQIGVQTLRGGDIVGDHTILFAGPGERLEILHQAHTRENFAQGALYAVQFIVKKNLKNGFYDMFDVLGLR